MISKRKIEIAIVIIAVVYLFISLNPFLTWIVSPILINVPVFVAVVMATLVAVSLGWTQSGYEKILISIPIIFFMLHTGTRLLGGPEWQFGKLMSFTGLLCIVFYNSSLHIKIFFAFRKLMLFFSWVAVVVFAITLVGIELPYYRIDGFTLVMMNSFGGESFYKLYGVVVSSTNTVYSFAGLTISRICGPFQEPGHFAIYIGLLVLFEKFICNRISKIFLVAGFLTFSPNFLIFLIVIMLYDTFYVKKVKNLLIFITATLAIVGFLWAIGDEIRNELLYLVIGRNFDHVEMDLDSILDNRAGKMTLEYYYSFLEGPKLMYGEGVESMEQFGILSDYRGMILKYGLIGLFSSILACLCIVSFAKNVGLRLIVIFILFSIYLQRTWMFELSFVYLFMVIGLTSYRYILKNNHEEIKSVQKFA